MKPAFFLAAALALAACETATTTPGTPTDTPPVSENPAPERPMDEVPSQSTLPNGDRQYGFRNGCAIVLEPERAVVKSESGSCQSYQRDIALLYASGDLGGAGRSEKNRRCAGLLPGNPPAQTGLPAVRASGPCEDDSGAFAPTRTRLG